MKRKIPQKTEKSALITLDKGVSIWYNDIVKAVKVLTPFSCIRRGIYIHKEVLYKWQSYLRSMRQLSFSL